MTTKSEEQDPQREGVLADLDSQGTTSFYWYLAVLSCIGGFLFGYDTSVIGSVLGFLPYDMGSFETGYLVAGAPSAPPSERWEPGRSPTASDASRC